MPRTILTLALFVIMCCVAACNPSKFKKVDGAEVDAAQKSSAEQFANAQMTSWVADKYPLLGDEATAELRAAHTEAAQRSVAKKIAAEFGDFKSLTFAEAQKSEPPKFVVYRFKATFSKLSGPAEVRVVYDLAGKVTGFFIRGWQEAL